MTTLCDILYRKYLICPYQQPVMLTQEYMKTSGYFDTSLENYKYSQTMDILLYILSSSFIHGFLDTQNTYIQEKYTYLKIVLNNPFLTDIQKNDFITCVQEVQRIHNILCRVAIKYKWKTSKYANQHDLIMNPINENQYFVCTIMQYNKKYLFTKSDLTKIIENALINSPYIYAEPLPIRNPYNNSIFGKSHLYNIYFFMKHGGFILPGIFHQYFIHNFHLKIFRDNTECMIREMHIKTMLISNSTTQIKEDIQTMIKLYNIQCRKKIMRIVIDDSFPPDILIRVMKPYLHLFYTTNYSLCMSTKSGSSNELAYRLNLFKKHSPRFGCKYVKRTNDKFTINPVNKTEFNTIYIPYIKLHYCKNYDTSHTEIIEYSSDEDKENIIPTRSFDINGVRASDDNDMDMSGNDMDMSGNDMDMSDTDSVNSNLYTTAYAGIIFSDDDDDADNNYDDESDSDDELEDTHDD